jgi:hypothetical protein
MLGWEMTRLIFEPNLHFVLLILLLPLVTAFSFHPDITKIDRASAVQLRSVTTETNTYSDIDADEIKKWFFLNKNKRADVSVSSASTLPGIAADIWRAILQSIRVLERDEEMKEYVSVVSFPSIRDTNRAAFPAVVEQVKQVAVDSPALMQNDFARSIEMHNMPSSVSGSSARILVSFVTVRSRPTLIDFDDIDEYVPSAEEIITNDIPEFPFPTIYDFISEINRPPDQSTMLSLRFRYTTKDLKYDLEKMKKKKNPQEVVDSINCKLSRLAQWRDVLTKESENEPDPFIESAEWGEQIKQRIRSLKALRSDPKKALDTQYNKRKTFVKIIDQWSDRLKRSFKFIYQSQRPPEDFKMPILRSKWRNEIVNASKLFSQSAFLDLKGPDFVVGAPAPLFDNERYLLWESDYPAGLALFEMLAWSEYIGPVAADFSLEAPIVQHTYSRGFITERVMADFWAAFSLFLESKPAPAKSLPAREILSDLRYGLSKTLRLEGPEEDHTEQFVKCLHALNDFTRRTSMKEMKPVKEMYRDLFNDGKELVDWWTTVVCDLDLTEEVISAADQRQRPWSEIMSELVAQNLEDETRIDDDPGKATYANNALSRWPRLRYAMQLAEQIESVLPWKNVENKQEFNIERLAALESVYSLQDETVHIDLKISNEHAPNSRSFVFVAPRYFRGIGSSEEITAFLEFSRIVNAAVQPVLAANGLEYKLVALHPQMVDQAGMPQFLRRSPHPALILTLL